MDVLNNPAEFRNRIVFEELQRTQNEEGHWVEKWIESSVGKSWSQIRNIRGNEFIMAGAGQVKVSARINMRYRREIEDKYYELGEKLRLNLKKKGRPDRIFNIEYINNLEERNIELEILVNEVR